MEIDRLLLILLDDVVVADVARGLGVPGRRAAGQKGSPPNAIAIQPSDVWDGALRL